MALMGTPWTRRSPIQPSPTLVLVVLCAAAFVSAADSTVVAAVLPAVLLDLRVPFADLSQASWIITAYLLGYVATLPLTGPLSDYAGRRLVAMGSLAVFAVGAALCVVAPTLAMLDVARGIQAVGGGALLPLGVAVVGNMWPAGRRGLALGLLAGAAELGSVCGPILGTALTAWNGWRTIFVGNLPVALLLGVAWWVVVPAQQHTRRRLDIWGGVILAALLAAFAVATNGAGTFTAASSVAPRSTAVATPPMGLWAHLAAGVLVVILMGVLWRVERGQPDGLIDTETVGQAGFLSAALTNMVVGVVLVVVLVDTPVFAALVLGWSPNTAGLVLVAFLLPLAIGSALGGVALGRAAELERARCGPVAICGLLLAACCLWMMSVWADRLPWWELAGPLIGAGLGLGLLAAPVSSAAVSAGGRALGTVTSLVTAARVVGMMGGLAVLTSWGTVTFRDLVTRIPFPLAHLSAVPRIAAQQIAAYETAVRHAEIIVFDALFRAASVTALVGILAALWLGRSPARNPHPGVSL